MMGYLKLACFLVLILIPAFYFLGVDGVVVLAGELMALGAVCGLGWMIFIRPLT